MKDLKIFFVLIIPLLFVCAFTFYKFSYKIDPEKRARVKLVSEKAPEIKGEKWINTDKPLTLENLKGKVVLIEFWTFECYNCKNTLPKVKGWNDKYPSDKFQVIGIHCPEFDSERMELSVKFCPTMRSTASLRIFTRLHGLRSSEATLLYSQFRRW